jgi:tetratricopeptide (TPR) repeat protein
MQQVTAFSRPQTVPAVPATVPRTNLWILGSWRDLILYVGTPLLLVPVFALAQARWSAQDIYVFVAAFGAMGHHLPGMIRAYGDRALFERFRWRFILAPIFLLTVCVGFYWWDLKGIVLMVFLWGVWHGMMQTYGFCRIYDAKMGSFAALTRRLDFAACGVWFAAAVLLSPARMTDSLEAFYESGAPFISPGVIGGLQRGIFAMAIAVTLLFLTNFVWMWSRGKRPNPVKLALLVTSISFWWYCNNGVTNILAGIALFEVFHDVQYLSLVWIYNRNRVEKDNTIGGFMRFVFRRSGSLIGLYIGLVFAYGSLGYLNSHIGAETLKRLLTGVVAASGLLHFYYDGFIWKVRERSTRQSLGLAGGSADATKSSFFPGWVSHGSKWAIAFVLPLTWFWFGQMRGTKPEVERSAWIVADLPAGARQHYNYGATLQKVGRIDEAVEQYRIALRFDPGYASAHVNLANALVAKSKLEEAQKHLQEALRLEPRSGDVHAGYAYLLERLGHKEEAEVEYQTAIGLNGRSARLLYSYGAFLEKNGKREEAIAQYQLALRADSRFADAHCDLASALFLKGELEQAKGHYLEAIRLEPNRADVHSNLGNVFLRQGQVSQAIVQYEEALRLDPKCKPAEENLRLAKASEARFRPRSPR